MKTTLSQLSLAALLVGVLILPLTVSSAQAQTRTMIDVQPRLTAASIVVHDDDDPVCTDSNNDGVCDSNSAKD